MHNLKSIRKWMDVTQEEMGLGIGCTQGNVGHYERGQTLPPEMARKLIAFAAQKGLVIGFDHIYGNAELPTKPAPESAESAQPAMNSVAEGA